MKNVLLFVFHFISSFHTGFHLRECKLLFLGLDNAGKTTLLNMLKTGYVQSYAPTMHPNKEELIVGRIKFTTHDLGGHETARKLWREFYGTGTNGVVFIVDAHDRARFPEASKALNELLLSEDLANSPFLVLVNKIDLPTAASEEDLRVQLGLTETYGKHTTGARDDRTRPIELYMCSIVKKMGYSDGFQCDFTKPKQSYKLNSRK